MKGERQKHEGRKAETERTVGRGRKGERQKHEGRKAEAGRMVVRDRTDKLKAEAGLAKGRSRKDDKNVDRQR